MFSQAIMIGAYWEPRKEGVEGCARRAADCFERLRQIHPAFRSWRQQISEERAEKDCENSWDAHSIAQHLQAAVTYPNVGSQPMHNLGHRISYLNDVPEKASSQISIRCECAIPSMGNLCLLEIATPGILTLEQITKTCNALIVAWEPEHAVVTSNSLLDTLAPNGKVYDAGWLMFQRGQSPKRSQLPREARVEEVPGQGTLIIATDEISFPPSASQVASIEQVANSLRGFE